MQSYQNQDDLIAEIKKRHHLFDGEFDNIPESSAHTLLPEVDRTPQQMLAYQIGWVSLLNSWEREEKAGKKVITPTTEYKWNNLGGLYQSFYKDYETLSLAECRTALSEQLEILYDWVGKLTDDEFFNPNERQWSVTNANWPVWKWVHINTVAPFKSFRTKIRKWKKLNTQN